MPKTVVEDKKASGKKGNNHGSYGHKECCETYKKFQREVQSVLVARGQKREEEDQ